MGKTDLINCGGAIQRAEIGWDQPGRYAYDRAHAEL
jgi:hypothetical protein